MSLHSCPWCFPSARWMSLGCSDALVLRTQLDPRWGAVLFAVPTDALANKLFGVPEPSTIARSLPTTVPESPNYRNARTPRTPRTPQLKDPTQTPRFYPVVKEGRTIDAKVGLGLGCTMGAGVSRLGPGEEGDTSLMRHVLQTPRKRKTRHSSNPPMECHVGWVMDSREHRPRTASIRYQRQAHGVTQEPEMGKGTSVGRKGKGSVWSCRGGLLLGGCRKDWDQTCTS